MNASTGVFTHALSAGSGEGGRRWIFARLECPVAALCRRVHAKGRDGHLRSGQDHAGTKNGSESLHVDSPLRTASGNRTMR